LLWNRSPSGTQWLIPMVEIIANLVFPLFFLILGWWFGSRAEKKHYRSIRRRERKWLEIPASNVRTFIPQGEILKVRLATGSVVIAVDQFKRLLAGLRNLFGGEVSAFSSLLDRARREAMLRMKEQHPEADEFINCRMETSTISSSASGGKGTVEILAYGTAIFYQTK